MHRCSDTWRRPIHTSEWMSHSSNVLQHVLQKMKTSLLTGTSACTASVSKRITAQNVLLHVKHTEWTSNSCLFTSPKNIPHISLFLKKNKKNPTFLSKCVSFKLKHTWLETQQLLDRQYVFDPICSRSVYLFGFEYASQVISHICQLSNDWAVKAAKY